MNRGGLKGTAFEVEDSFTAFTAERMQAGPNIHGALIGRNLLFPGAEDPRAMAAAVAAIAHDHAGLTAAQTAMAVERGAHMRLIP